jgi:hypothetical protein
MLALALSAHGATLNEFTGPFDVSQWSLSTSGGVIDTSAAPASIRFVSSDDGSGPTAQTMTIAATTAATVAFSWTYNTQDSAPVWDAFGFTVNAVFHPVSVDIDPLSQAGNSSFTIAAGDVFGFAALSYDSASGAATTVISSFSFTEIPAVPVPEPATLPMMSLALASGLALRRLFGRAGKGDRMAPPTH